MVRTNLYENFVPGGTKVEEQEGNTQSGVKTFPLFIKHCISVAKKLLRNEGSNKVPPPACMRLLQSLKSSFAMTVPQRSGKRNPQHDSPTPSEGAGGRTNKKCPIGAQEIFKL